MGLTSRVKLGFGGEYTSTETGVLAGTPTLPIAIPEKKQEYGDGTGSNQGDLFYSKSWSAAAAADTHDLTGGLTDVFGTALTFVKVRHLIIHNKSTTSGEDLLVSGNFFTGALLSGWVDDAVKELIEPGGTMVKSSPVDGYTVTATTQDQLIVDPGANTIAYDLIIIGTSA